MARNTLLLVDGNNLLYRSFFALPRLTRRSDGLPNGALHGFVAILRKLLREESPAFAAVAFDAPGSTFRHESFPEYKANRPPMPPELAQQVPYTRDLARTLGIQVLEVPGVEADDVIGTLAVAGSGEGYRVLIVSGDKDLLQVVGERVTVCDPANPAKRLDPEGVRRKLHVPPERVPDYLGLVGDSVDNVPGVPGIGPKTAVKLIADWGGLEDILAHTGDLPRAFIAKRLTAHVEQARQSRELVQLRLDVPIPEAGERLEGLRYTGVRTAKARSLFEELGLRTHARDMGPAEPPTLPAVTAAGNASDLARVLEGAARTRMLALHPVFAPGRARLTPGLVAVGLASSEKDGLSLETGELDLMAALAPLRGDGVRLIGHGLQSFVRWWMERGGEPLPVAHDSDLAAWLLNTTRRARSFGDVLQDHCQLSLPSSARRDLFRAAHADERLAVAAAWQHRLTAALEAELEERGLLPVFRDIEMPLLPVLARIETRGVLLDTAALGALSRDMEARVGELTAEIHELAGGAFNIGSPKQLAEVLFDRLQLPLGRKTKKLRRASTRAEVLEDLARLHELPRLVLEYRELEKLRGTYVDPLPGLVSPRTGRLHTRLHQSGAATGRLSSSDPNLQNIPVRTRQGRQVRRAFIAPEGRRLISVDYSQIELRILAHLSGDPALTEAFQAGEDIHDRTAREVFGPFGLDPREARARAKVVNYSVIYGKTAFTLSREIGVSRQDAQAFISAYFGRYLKVKELIDAIVAEARKTGRVTTLFGRQRDLPEIRTSHHARRAAAERMAVNAPIQGTAADLMKLAMPRVETALAGTSGQVLLQVHDELLIEADAQEAEAVSAAARREMETVANLTVPLEVQVTISRHWDH